MNKTVIGMGNEIITPVLCDAVKALPFYVTQISSNYTETIPIQRWGGSGFYQLSLCVGGCGIFQGEGTSYSIRKGDLFLFGPKSDHLYYPQGNEPWVCHFVCFHSTSLFPPFTQTSFVRANLASVSILQQFDRMYRAAAQNNITGQLEASAYLYALLLDLYRADTVGHSSKLDLVFQYLETHYAEDISLNDLSQKIGVSDSYLCRLFQKHTQMSPIQYLIALRINKAKEQLILFPAKNIQDISADCGYRNCSYFCYEFKRVVGLTPREFQESQLGSLS